MFPGDLGHYLTYHNVTQSFFRGHRDKFDGLIIPLSVATIFRQGTGGFVLTLKKPYAIDPRTPIFQAEFERKRIRQAHIEMAAVHGSVIETLFRSRPLTHGDFGPIEIDEVAKGVLTFQKRFAETSAEKVQKYAALLGEDAEESYRGPAFLIPPYFGCTSLRDPWYRLSLGLAKACGRYKDKFRLAPVIHITKGFPEDDFETLVRDYSDDLFDGIIVFVNDLQEYVAPRAVLSKLAGLITILRGSTKPLFSLFGGYFTLMLRKIGLPFFSNAVGYGEYRDSGYHAGGQAVKRYYIPALHRYFTNTVAQSILDVVNEKWLRCTCNVCSGKRLITRLTSQELLSHFLNIRLEEIEHARATSLATLLDEMQDTTAKLDSKRFPVDPSLHLQEWVAALGPFA